MRFSVVRAILQKELLDLVRDRRSLISMAVVPVFVFPLLISGMLRLIPMMEEKSATEARGLPVGARISTPSIREELEKAGLKLAAFDDLKAAVEKKTAGAAVEEIPGTPPNILLYVDFSNPTSTAAGERIREVLTALKDRRVQESLRSSGIDTSVLKPFNINRQNVAGSRKMAGAAWGSMLGYILLLLMFTGGMYPIMDMTVGEKERKTLEAFLASPADRREMVTGKMLAAICSIVATAVLTLGSMVYSFKSGAASTARTAGGERFREVFGTIPLDPPTVALLAAILIPLAMFAASVMFAIALKARSFKEAQTYLTPLMFMVIFPALLGGLPGLQITPVLCLIPIFNASQMIRSIMLGDVSMLNFAVTTTANLVYAALAFVMATRMFQDENVLFRT